MEINENTHDAIQCDMSRCDPSRGSSQPPDNSMPLHPPLPVPAQELQAQPFHEVEAVTASISQTVDHPRECNPPDALGSLTSAGPVPTMPPVLRRRKEVISSSSSKDVASKPPPQPTAALQKTNPEVQSGAAPKMPVSSWGDDDDDDNDDDDSDNAAALTTKSKKVLTKSRKIEDTLTTPLKLTITLDESTNRLHSAIYSISELETFAHLKHIISSPTTWLHHKHKLPPSVHLDKFTIVLTNSIGERISSDVRPSERKYRITGTEHSSETFDALMAGAVVARCEAMSRARGREAMSYCVCGECDLKNEKEKQQKTRVKCPEIRIRLASLDLSNERMYRGKKGRVIDPKKVVIVDYEALGLLPTIDERGDDGVSKARVVLDPVCVRNIVESASGMSRSVGQMDVMEEAEEDLKPLSGAGMDGGNDVKAPEKVRSKLCLPRSASQNSKYVDIPHSQLNTAASTPDGSEVIEISDDDEEHAADGDVSMANC